MTERALECTDKVVTVVVDSVSLQMIADDENAGTVQKSLEVGAAGCGVAGPDPAVEMMYLTTVIVDCLDVWHDQTLPKNPYAA